MPVEAPRAREVAAACPLFAGVPPDVVTRTLEGLEILALAPGERVLVEAMPGTAEENAAIYILIEGQLLASRAIPDGRTQRLSTIVPGEFFGELALADEGARSATVTAVTAATVGRLSATVVDQLVGDAPGVMRTIAASLARRLRAADEARLAARLSEERLSLVGRAAAMLMHDLKNPLGVVRNASELIADGVGDPRAWAARSRNAADFMLDMVKDLLDYAKGDRIYAREPVALHQVIEDVDAFGLGPLEADGKITIRRQIGGDAMLLGDRRALSRALLNIVRNAGEAMSAGGTLTFRSSVEDGVVRCTIEDTGPGIPEGILPTLFEPFATHGKRGGTGLGMAMTKAAVEGHGGQVTVETRPGNGTTFVVRLPTADSPRGGRSVADPPPGKRPVRG